MENTATLIDPDSFVHTPVTIRKRSSKYAHWLTKQKAGGRIGVSVDPNLTSNTPILDQKPIATLSNRFVEMKLEELKKRWNFYILESIWYDDEWRISDLARALLVIRERLKKNE